MFDFFKQPHDPNAAMLAALDRAQAIMTFDLDGTVLSANDNALRVLGYDLQEVVGRPHAIFVDGRGKASGTDAAFWAALRGGERRAGVFRRVAKDGRDVFLEASYDLMRDASGKPFRVVAFATDVTARRHEELDAKGQVVAIGRTNAVIAFTPDGVVLDANENFLAAVGYRLDEIRGRHHALFVDPAERESAAYRAFWSGLARGEPLAARFKRIAKGGREIWIQASYNPIFDDEGRICKVVKYAVDVTEQMDALADLRRRIVEIEAAISRSDAQAADATRGTGETSGHVRATAATSEELAASVGEIASMMSKARTVNESAFSRANAAGDSTARLATAVSQMSGIVSLIGDIAGQINLLALNAAIEAARAGEAGRGFAVVAQEVKNLAGQAARATQQIGAEIDAVQAISGDVVGALDGIRDCVTEMREHVAATAASLEQQEGATREMSRTLQSTSSAIASIAEAVAAMSHEVSRVAEETREAGRAAERLAR
ncbi:methyl-accepting chemotaxis protein [Salinarimonas sp.]|uniref:methyl-accepting chemotaxis protein n=1 Tax=Salinarimonas sp. TaxID=2766526 RepID=UPI00391915D2